MKHVLITGSQGYLGSVLSGMLVDHGYRVTGFDTGFFRESKLGPIRDAGELIDKDVRNLTDSDLDSIDAVIHLASISNDPLLMFDEEQVYGPSRVYTKRLASMCKQRGIKFVFASSCSVYGVGGNMNLNEKSMTNPQTGYSKNKIEIEADLAELADESFSPIALRFATIFGFSPRIRFDVVVNMFVGMALTTKQIILNSDGQAWRPNLHILDACAALIGAVKLQPEKPGLVVLNIGSEKNNLKIIDMANAVASIVPGCSVQFLAGKPDSDPEGLIKDRKVDPGAGDVRTYSVSFEAVERVMPDFKCSWDFHDGVEVLITDLEHARLTREVFKSPDFYRLQKLEQLLREEYLSTDLFWRRKLG